jgi:hypothetical protein
MSAYETVSVTIHSDYAQIDGKIQSLQNLQWDTQRSSLADMANLSKRSEMFGRTVGTLVLLGAEFPAESASAFSRITTETPLAILVTRDGNTLVDISNAYLYGRSKVPQEVKEEGGANRKLLYRVLTFYVFI